MARNQSEKVPFPELSREYHARARTWAAFKLSGISEDEAVWTKAYLAWAVSGLDVGANTDIIFNPLTKFYYEQMVTALYQNRMTSHAT